MQITCPSCGTPFPLTAGVNDAEARRFAALMGELPPPIARLMPDYLGLFKPLKQGLRWARMVKLLGELQPEIQSAQVTRQGRTWAAPQPLWVAALEQVIERRDTLTLPLAGHGYLREVVAGMANRAAGQAEAQREEARRNPYARDQQGGPRSAGEITQARRDAWDQELQALANQAGQPREDSDA